jgi:hypothetical protein
MFAASTSSGTCALTGEVVSVMVMSEMTREYHYSSLQGVLFWLHTRLTEILEGTDHVSLCHLNK